MGALVVLTPAPGACPCSGTKPYTTYRLEISPGNQMYEGVRYSFLTVNTSKLAAGVRLTCACLAFFVGFDHFLRVIFGATPRRTPHIRRDDCPGRASSRLTSDCYKSALVKAAALPEFMSIIGPRETHNCREFNL